MCACGGGKIARVGADRPAPDTAQDSRGKEEGRGEQAFAAGEKEAYGARPTPLLFTALSTKQYTCPYCDVNNGSACEKECKHCKGPSRAVALADTRAPSLAARPAAAAGICRSGQTGGRGPIRAATPDLTGSTVAPAWPSHPPESPKHLRHLR